MNARCECLSCRRPDAPVVHIAECGYLDRLPKIIFAGIDHADVWRLATQYVEQHCREHAGDHPFPLSFVIQEDQWAGDAPWVARFGRRQARNILRHRRLHLDQGITITVPGEEY